ncbi:phage major capsid protein [Aquincola tertiaricarbonis]|uniref:phage major capsid protein n=1 Tax=Aquincola tertiaricarbonis TaxID=391953 RepID=UPI00069696BD|nr:phage major capsid protein [Aquincola tertiaricarbonis]
MTRKNQLAVSAIAVALAFGFSSAAAIVCADTVTIESLQDRLLELKDQANNIQSRADAEARDLTEDEQREVEGIFAQFEATEADIERRQRLDQINNKMATPQPRRTTPEPLATDEGEGAGNQPAARQRQASTPARVFATPRQTDTGKWGFRSFAEFTNAVLKSSGKGAQLDPRLVANAAPTSYGSEGVGADGGFAVPPDFRTTIMTKVMGEDSLLTLADQQVSSGNSITFPADETTPWQTSGGIQAYWESEGGLKQQSKPALVEKTVKLNKIIALVPMTDELLEDAPAMASYVNRKAPEKINFKINDAIINGTGVGMPLGILKSPGTVVVAKESGQAADSVVYQNITKLWSSLTPSARRNARWLMNADVEQQLMNMQFPGTGTAVPAYMPPGGLSAAPYGTLLGRPIFYSEAMPALGDQGDIVFGDLTNYLAGVKTGGIKNDVSIHLWFDYDLTAFRFVLRVGGQPWWNAPIEGAQPGSSARGFFATLGPRA